MPDRIVSPKYRRVLVAVLCDTHAPRPHPSSSSSRRWQACSRPRWELSDSQSFCRPYVDIYAGVLRNQRMCLGGMSAAEHETLFARNADCSRHFFERNEQWLLEVSRQGRDDGVLTSPDLQSMKPRFGRERSGGGPADRPSIWRYQPFQIRGKPHSGHASPIGQVRTEAGLIILEQSSRETSLVAAWLSSWASGQGAVRQGLFVR